MKLNEITSNHVVPVLYASADNMNGTMNTDIVKCAGSGIVFEMTKAVGATGTSTITVDACDDVTPSNTTAVAFYYRASTTPDTWGDWTAATAAGFVTTAGSNQMYQVYVDNQTLGALGYEYARLTGVEVVSSAVIMTINAHILNTHYAPQPSTVLT